MFWYVHCHASCSTQSYNHLEFFYFFIFLFLFLFFFAFSINFITIPLVLTFLKLFGKIASWVCKLAHSQCGECSTWNSSLLGLSSIKKIWPWSIGADSGLGAGVGGGVDAVLDSAIFDKVGCKCGRVRLLINYYIYFYLQIIKYIFI